MDLYKRTVSEFLSFREDDPGDLKQDIEDEIADHLECAHHRELQRTGDEDLAHRRVLERFGDPARIAGKLWWDAIRERIMKKWIPYFLVPLLVICACVFPLLHRARTRATVTKAIGEMRSLATALFDYDTALINAGKEGIFPPADGWVDASETIQEWRMLVEGRGEGTFYFGRIEEIWPSLTSPIQVVSSIPRDPFDPEGGSYRAAGVGSLPGFLIIGMGPDGDLDLTPEVLEKPMLNEFSADRTQEVGSLLGCPGCGTLSEALRVGTFVYSPTNGSFSNGDLIRISQ